MLSKVPLVVGLFALLFAVGSLLVPPSITPWRLTDCLFWLLVALLSVLALGVYALVLQKLGVLETVPPTSVVEGPSVSGPEAASPLPADGQCPPVDQADSDPQG